MDFRNSNCRLKLKQLKSSFIFHSDRLLTPLRFNSQPQKWNGQNVIDGLSSFCTQSLLLSIFVPYARISLWSTSIAQRICLRFYDFQPIHSGWNWENRRIWYFSSLDSKMLKMLLCSYWKVTSHCTIECNCRELYWFKNVGQNSLDYYFENDISLVENSIVYIKLGQFHIEMNRCSREKY